jgi:hypothetical protein
LRVWSFERPQKKLFRVADRVNFRPGTLSLTAKQVEVTLDRERPNLCFRDLHQAFYNQDSLGKQEPAPHDSSVAFSASGGECRRE